MNFLPIEFPDRTIIDFEVVREQNLGVFLCEGSGTRVKTFLRIHTFQTDAKSHFLLKKESDLEYTATHISVLRRAKMVCGVLCTKKLLHLHQVSSTMTLLISIPLLSLSPFADFYFASQNSFVTFSLDGTILLYQFTDQEAYKTEVAYNFLEEAKEFPDHYLTSSHILFKKDEGILVKSLENGQQTLFSFKQFAICSRPVYLFSFIKENPYYNKFLKMSKNSQKEGRQTKRKSQVQSFELMIDESIQEKFTTLKQEKKNRFIFLPGNFLVLISKNDYILDFFDVNSKTRYQLNICFKAIWLLESPFIYLDRETRSSANLILVFGFKELLGFLVSLEPHRKCFQSIFFINDFDYCITKAHFIDPDKISLQSEVGSFYAMTLALEAFL